VMTTITRMRTGSQEYRRGAVASEILMSSFCLFGARPFCS
jgi:hypothetical protein